MSEEKIKPELEKNLLKLKKYIFSKVSDVRDAEEILEETLISAQESFSFFEGRSSFLTWLCGIANHEIADFYRKRKIKTLLFSHFPFLENIISGALSADESLEKQELRKEVKKVLSCLTEGYGEILRLKYYQGLSMAEIARRLRTTVKAVESRLSRARQAFRKQWNYTNCHSERV